MEHESVPLKPFATSFLERENSMSLAVPSGASSQNLLLDSEIRDWVVLPLLAILIASGMLRQATSKYMRAGTRSISPVECRAKSLLQRSARLRTGAGAGCLDASKWEGRRSYYCQETSAGGSSDPPSSLLRMEAERAKEEIEAAKKAGGGGAGPGEIDMNNPMSMMEGMKGNMTAMVQNMVMMQGISHFFRGYVLLKVPFPLTNGFKMMFHRGLDLAKLETSYVSSLSWYFLVIYGLRGFFRLVLGDEPPRETQEATMLQHSFGTFINVPGGPGQNFDAAAALKAEAEALEMTMAPSAPGSRRVSMLVDAEKRLLGSRYPKRKKKSTKNPGDEIFGFGTTKKNKLQTK